MSIDMTHRYKKEATESYTLPAQYYTSEEILDLEKEKIFSKNWMYAGHIEKVDVPGKYFTLQILDQNIMIVKGKDDEIRAFYNVCPHRGHELVEGEGKTSVIKCPYHAWTFHLDGEFNRGRSVDKIKNFEQKDACLNSVKVEVFLNFIFINLDPNARPMGEMMPGLDEAVRAKIPELENLTLAKRIRYDIKANWKNIMDNYLECHHCQVAHPEFVKQIDMSSYAIIPNEYYIAQTSRSKGTTDKTGEINASDAETYLSFWLYPTLALDIMPGEPGIIMMHIEPISANESIEYLEFYYTSKEPSEEGLESIKYQDEVLTPEDISLVESVQRGLKSKGYVDGRYVIDDKASISEHGVHYFHGLVLNSLEGVK